MGVSVSTRHFAYSLAGERRLKSVATMSRTIGGILSAIGTVALVATGVGAIGGLALFGTLSGISVGGLGLSAGLGSLLLASSALTQIGGALNKPPAPKPETTETPIKTERPPRVSGYGRRRLYGAYNCFETAPNGTAVDVFAFHDGEIDAIEAFYLNDDRVTLSGSTVQGMADGRYKSGAVNLYATLGQAVGPGLPAVTALLGSEWSDDHRGDGVVIGAMTAKAVKSDDYLETYPNGPPVMSIVARLQKCPDFTASDPSDPAGWTWTENSLRHLAHYALVHEGLDWQTKFAPSIAYWQQAQAVCEGSVPLKAGGAEARYRSCLTHKHTDDHARVKEALLSTFDGWLAPRADGALIVFAGQLYTPTISIGASEIIAFEWAGVGVDDDTAINEVICAYVSADHDYGTVDTDPWTDELDIAARGQVLPTNLDPQVPSHGQVRRLAKREIARTNAIHRGTITTNPEGRKVRGERYINLRIEEAGTVWFDGVAEIRGLTRNLSSGGVTFEWIEVDPNVDAWNPATEEGDPAPVGARVALAPLDAPVITDVDVSLDDSGASARARVMVEDIGREDTTWYLRWRVTTDAAWNEQTYSDAQEGAGVLLVSALLPVNDSIDIQVSYGIGDGRISPWSATETVSTTTANLAPAPVTDVSVTGGAGEIGAAWRNPGSTNYSYTRAYYGTTATFSAATALTPDDAAGTLAYRSVTFTGIAPGTYHLWVEAFSPNDVGSGPVKVTGTVTVT